MGLLVVDLPDRRKHYGRDDFYAAQSERFVEEIFDGSHPAFIAAFTKRKALTAEEIKSIRQIID